MKAFLPIVFASIAAVGNAIFALAQSKNAGAAGSLVFVSLSVLVAAVFGFFDADDEFVAFAGPSGFQAALQGYFSKRLWAFLGVCWL